MDGDPRIRAAWARARFAPSRCPLTIDFEAIVNAERAPCARSGEARRYEYPLAEDNDLNREIALFILTEAGAKVTCADDGFKALGAFEQADAGTFDF